MIRINLLPEEQRGEEKRMSGLLLGAIAVFAALLVIVAVHLWKVNQIENAKAKLARIKKEVKELEQVKAKVEEYKAKTEELKARLNLIEVLEDNRNGPLFVMDSLAEAIPERAWLDKLSEKNFSAVLEGVAWNEKTVADFMRQLQASPYFQSVELKEIKTKKLRDLPLKTFKIQAQLNYSGKTKEEAGEAVSPQDAKPSIRED
jgi:type IV pilus assembly protein PilN